MQVGLGSNLSYDPKKGNYWLDRDPVFVFTAEAMLLMFNNREKIFGSGAHLINFQAGESLGACAIDQLLAPGIDRRIILLRFNDVGSRWGFGYYKLRELREEPTFQMVFDLHHMPFYEKAAHQLSFMFFLRGFYAGFFKGLLGKDVKVEHQVLGDRQAVRFQITQAEAIKVD